MINWIARWFIAQTGCTGRPAAPPAPAAQAPRPNRAYPAGIPQCSTAGWPARPAANPPSTERLILDELARLVCAGSGRRPGAARAGRDPATAAQPARRQHLRRRAVAPAGAGRGAGGRSDPRSEQPLLPARRAGRNIEGAIMLLGQNGMRMLLARVAFRPDDQQPGRAISRARWRRRSGASPRLRAGRQHAGAPACGANPFEAYLAGLLQNVGLIVAFRLIDQIYTGRAAAVRRNSAPPCWPMPACCRPASPRCGSSRRRCARRSAGRPAGRAAAGAGAGLADRLGQAAHAGRRRRESAPAIRSVLALGAAARGGLR